MANIAVEECETTTQATGRPRIYDDPDEFRRKAEEYFEECKKNGDVPTKFGICLHLGFSCYHTLYVYAKREEFKDTCGWIDLKIAAHLAQALCRGEGNIAGKIFLAKITFPERPVEDRIVFSDGNREQSNGRVVVVTRDPAGDE